jgi:hypothetical protein
MSLGMVMHTVIPALERLRQENCELKANLGYIVRLFKIETLLKIKRKKFKKKGLQKGTKKRLRILNAATKQNTSG